VIKPGEAIMILELHRQGLSVSAIARRLGTDRKTMRKYIARGLEPPLYGPRQPRPCAIDLFLSYLRERVAAYPDLTGKRLWREIKERGFEGCYSAVTDALRELRPPAAPAGFEVRFETPPGRQAQVDFASASRIARMSRSPCVVRMLLIRTARNARPARGVAGQAKAFWRAVVLSPGATASSRSTVTMSAPLRTALSKRSSRVAGV
jgi:hypothetical protein